MGDRCQVRLYIKREDIPILEKEYDDAGMLYVCETGNPLIIQVDIDEVNYGIAGLEEILNGMECFAYAGRGECYDPEAFISVGGQNVSVTTDNPRYVMLAYLENGGVEQDSVKQAEFFFGLKRQWDARYPGWDKTPC